MKNNVFLAYWCSEGFEHIQDITRYETWEQEQLMNLLRDVPIKSNPLNEMINSMKLRARFNEQRNYELYVFQVSKELEFEDVKSMSEHSPQALVDWIRKNGLCLHSDRRHPKVVIV